MWFAIALIVVSFLATALLTPKPKLENARSGSLNDFTFPRSNEGDPIPYLRGTVKITSPNTIWTGNFSSVAITKSVQTGIFTSTKQVLGYKYYIGMDLAWCLGPNVVMTALWFGTDVAWTGSIGTETTLDLDFINFFGGDTGNGGIQGVMAFYPGSAAQSQDSYLVQQIGAGVPAYNGVCHTVFRDFYMGNSTSIEAISGEFQCFSNSLGLGPTAIMPNGKDQNPAELLYDIFVNPDGALGLASTYFDVSSFTSAAATLYAEGNGMSLYVATANTGDDITQEILRQINGVLYQSNETGLITLKLIRADYNVNTIPVLTPVNVASITSYSKSLWNQTMNQVRVSYTNRDNGYAQGVAVWQDFANINMQQKVRSTSVSMPGCYDSDVANSIAAYQGSQLNVPLFTCEFVADRTTSQMKPGDVFVLNWQEFGQGNVVMRVRTIDRGVLEDGQVDIQCTQDVFSSPQAVFSVPAVTQWTSPNLGPGTVAIASVFAAPYYFQQKSFNNASSTTALLWALAVQPDKQSQGYNMIYSTDGFSQRDHDVGMTNNSQYPGSGALQAAYASTVGFATGFDGSTTGIVVFDLDGAYTPVTDTDADIRSQGVNLILIGGEIMAYRTATTTGLPVGQVRLTNIWRALFDTKFQTHSPSDVVYFMSTGSGIGSTTFGPTDTPVIRLQDRAIGGTEDITTAPDIGPITINQRPQRPAPPTMLTYGGVRSGSSARSAVANVAWFERNRTSGTVVLYNDPTQTAEAGQDNQIVWSINGGAATTVNVTGTSTTIDTSHALAGDILSITISSRLNGTLLSIANETITITLT